MYEQTCYPSKVLFYPSCYNECCTLWREIRNDLVNAYHNAWFYDKIKSTGSQYAIDQYQNYNSISANHLSRPGRGWMLHLNGSG